METLRLPDYYIDSNGLPNILNNNNNKQQQLIIKRPTTKCGCNTVTKQNVRRQDANEIEKLIVRPNSHEIKNLILTQQHRTTDAGLNKKIKCMYNEMKKKHIENKTQAAAAAAQLKEQNLTHRNREDIIS